MVHICTYIFAEAVLLQQALHESALHGGEQVLRVKVAEAGPVGEECFRLVPDGGGSVGELQQGQVGLLHPLENSNVLPLGTQHPAPQQVQLAAAGTTWKREKELTSAHFPSDKTAEEVREKEKKKAPKMKTAESNAPRSNTVMIKSSEIAC